MDAVDEYSRPPRTPRPGSRPPRLRRYPAFARGPSWYTAVTTRRIHTGGPGEVPPEFLTPTTSRDEWWYYWASMRVLDPDRDPREPPFTGGRLWKFQSPELGTYVRALGSAVADFVYEVSYPFLIVRIQTYRFHTAASAQQQAFDRVQLLNLSGRFDVIDVYSESYMGDPTGQAAIIVVKSTLGMIRQQSPITAHTTRLIRGRQM